MRIVSLLPSTTEICVALGLTEHLAAVTHECDYPPAVRQLPHITRSLIPREVTASAAIDRFVRERVARGQPLYELDLSLLEQIEPDLILTQQLCSVCAVAYDEVLSIARRLPSQPRVASIEPETVDDVLASIQAIGRLTGREATASAVVAALRQRIDMIRASIDDAGAMPRRVVCLEWINPLMAAGHWVPEMVALAGGYDLLGQAGQPSFTIDWQQVIDAKPDVLLLMPCGYDLDQTAEEADVLAECPELDSIPAVQNGHVYAVDGSGYFNRPGPRIVNGIEILAGILHPEATTGRGPANTAQAVRFLHREQAR